jgi:feruloyl-CoA synthase
MTDAPPLREVETWSPEIAWERRADGTLLVWQKAPLPDYPPRLSDRIAHWARTRPDRVWMAERAEDGGWAPMTYGALLPAIRSLAQGLLDLDLSAERPLAILSGNSIAHALMALAAQHVGIPSAAIAPAYSTAASDFTKLRQVRAQISPGAVFAEDLGVFAPALDAVFADLPRLGVRGAGQAVGWDRLRATPATAAVDRANAATGPDTVAKFMFTSGTTGSPKAVIQTQRMLCANMEMVRDCYRFFETVPPVVVDWAPWNHVASGNKVFNMVLYNGGTFYIDAGRPMPGAFADTLRNLREVSPTWYFNVPAGYELLVEAMREDGALAQRFFADLRLMMYAGAAMGAHTWAELDRLAVEVTGARVLMSTGYGATETAPFALACTEPQAGPGNVGVPARGLTLKLVPVGDKLEAHIRGPSVTPGYWRDPAQTAEAFDAEGYFNLGDALRPVDPEDPGRGFLFDGRTAENFKMATGTWVGVGALRKALTDALEGLARSGASGRPTSTGRPPPPRPGRGKARTRHRERSQERQHPEDGGERRHEDRPDPVARRLLDGVDGRHALFAQVIERLVHDQDRVVHHDAHQDHEAQKREHVERLRPIRFSTASPPTPPAAATGTEIRMTSGRTKLSNRIAITRKTIRRATIRLIWMAFHVWDSWSAVPETERRTPGGRPCSSSGAITSVSSSSTAASSGRASEGRTSSVTVRRRSRWRISVGPAVTCTSASSEAGTI